MALIRSLGWQKNNESPTGLIIGRRKYVQKRIKLVLSLLLLLQSHKMTIQCQHEAFDVRQSYAYPAVVVVFQSY